MHDKPNSSVESFTMSNGVKIPAVGFGTAFGNWTEEGFTGFTPEDAWSALPKAFNAGVRHFDTAYVYRTHRHFGMIAGEKFREGSMERKDLFVTTKVFHPDVPGFTAAKTIDIDAAIANGTVEEILTKHFFESLDELGLGYVDLLLLHWPGKKGQTDKQACRQLRKQAWEVMEAMYNCGKARAIGVSNWTEGHLADLLADGAKVTPHVNQIEMNPYTVWTNIIKYCKEKGILIEAYSPMGSGAGTVRKDPVLVALAKKYNKNTGQVILRWLVQQGVVVLPRSSSEHRIRTNMEIFDFTIDDEDMERIAALNKSKSLTNNSPYDML